MFSNFYINKNPLSLLEIAEKLQLKIKCPINSQITEAKDVLIYGVNTIDDASQKEITVLHNKKYISNLKNTKAIAVITSDQWTIYNSSFWLLQTSNPYHAYSLLLDLFYEPKYKKIPLIEETAYIDKSAKIGKNSYIGHNVVIEEDVEIGENSFIDAGVIIKYGVKIGQNALINSNVVISHSLIGNNVVILPGAKIGQDGFGFSTEKGLHRKVFHIGWVIIGDNVEIGANVTIDKGSIKDTIIGNMCRIDNLVQIGHNVEIGDGTIVVSQVGVSGSTKIGKYCALGGQSGLSGHLNIGNYVQIAAQSGVIHDIPDFQTVGGYPAIQTREWHKQTIILKNLIKKKYD